MNMSPTIEPPTLREARPGIIVRLTRWSLSHVRLVAAGWVALVVVAMLASSAAKPHYVDDLSLPGTDSQRAADVLSTDFARQSGDVDQIVLRASHGRITDPAIRARVTPVLAHVARLPHVTAVLSPFTPDGRRAVSVDGRTAFASVTFDARAAALPKAAVDRVIAVARSASSGAVGVELGGRAIQEVNRPSLGAATAIGLVASIVILLFTFGSALAAGLPLITALLGLGSALGLIGLGSKLLDTPDFATQLAALLGLGVGIDYALFIVTRFRENYRAGDDVRTAIESAMDTAGRAVLFAGLTVIIALLGMFVLGIALLEAAALATALSVALTMSAALMMLPVLLSRFGERIGNHTGRRARDSTASFWPRWARLVTRHPWPALVAGLSTMALLVIPALSLRLGQSDAGNDPSSLTSRRAYDLLARGFGPGFNGPLQVVARLRHTNRAALTTVSSALARTRGVASVSPPLIGPGGQAAVFEVFPRTAPESQQTTDLVTRLRDQRLPPLARVTGAPLLVGGATATGVDFASVLGGKLALFIGVVVLLAGLLLAMVFRSVVIPVQAALMNVLSVGASLGVAVAVFQYGWLGSLFNVKAGPIEAFIPVILFAIVFGLSMDYEVFLISRIHEAFKRHRDPTRAVIDGLDSTGRVVTAAATIMICVFVSFVLGDQRVVKLFGLSLASAVFLDAFVVRSLLLPSVLTLLGRDTWRLPQLLERRLPRIAVEAPDVRTPPRIASEPVLDKAS